MKLSETLTAFADIRASLGGLLPEAVLLTGLVLVILIGLVRRLPRLLLPITAALTLVGAGWALWSQPTAAPFFQRMLLTDAPARSGGLLVLLSGLLAVAAFELMPPSGGPGANKRAPQHFTFLLTMMLGGLLLVRTVHGIGLVLAIELLSLPSYALVLTRRHDPPAARAALNYVLLGAIATGAMLYGLSVLYGLTGSLHFADPEFWARLTVAPTAPLVVAVALFLAGLLFKLGAAPLHFWVPDAYAAAPLPVALLLSTAPKVAAAVALWRFQAEAVSHLSAAQANAVALLLTGAALLSLAVGTLGALSQPNVRRLLGFSSIAQAGFLLLSIRATGAGGGAGPVLLYAAFLVLANGATFLAIGGFEQLAVDGLRPEASAYAGLGRRFPLLGTALTVGMVALTGLPPTVGFSAKLVAFTTLWQADASVAGRVLLVAGLLLTVASLYFYLRVPYWLFLKEETPEAGATIGRPTALTWCAVGLTGLLVLAFVKADWVM